MKSNLIIKILAVVIVVVLLVVILKANKSQNGGASMGGLTPAESGPDQPDNGLALDPLQPDFLEDEYGVDVDSPIETMRTLTRETRAVREESQALQDENKRLRQEIDRLLRLEESINTRISNRFTTAEKDAEARQRELQQAQNQTRSLIAGFEKRLRQLQEDEGSSSGQRTANGYDIDGAGIPSGLGYDNAGGSINFDELVWTQPLESEVDPTDPTKITMPDFTAVAADGSLPNLATAPPKKEISKEERSIKAYTIPENGTLIGSVSMTAMLGRIPINGQVVDPYPFKVMVGPENLSSNGIHIPGVVGIKMSGIAKGDWTLSCVSGEINSMTFTFQDGTILTYPEPGKRTRDPIAWFSDANGIPCVTGERITNAATYLSSRVALTAAASYANAEADSQFTTSTNTDGGFTRGLTGDPKTVAKNQAISEGINEVTDWFDARQENSFDAIYVPPGTELAIHITEELKIDYDPKGRKVNHYANINRRSDSHLD